MTDTFFFMVFSGHGNETYFHNSEIEMNEYINAFWTIYCYFYAVEEN